MDNAVDHNVTRREVIEASLRAGLLVSASASVLGLFGCQSNGASVRARMEAEHRAKNPISSEPRWTPPTQPSSAPATNSAGYFDTPSGVVARSQWTQAKVVQSRSNPMVRIERITIHHDAIDSRGMSGRSAAADRLNRIRTEHMNRADGYADIGYHFAIDPQGNVWECRPLSYQGAHVKDNNERNMGVMVMGNFMTHSPTSAQVQSLERFVVGQMRRYGVGASRLYTHRELGQTACPGDMLQRVMVASRRSGGVFVLA